MESLEYFSIVCDTLSGVKRALEIVRKTRISKDAAIQLVLNYVESVMSESEKAANTILESMEEEQ